MLEELGSLFAEASLEHPPAVFEGDVEQRSSSDVDMLWEYFDKKVAHSTSTSSPTTKAIMMVKQYLSIPNYLVLRIHLFFGWKTKIFCKNYIKCI
jgi:hypothetical protein